MDGQAWDDVWSHQVAGGLSTPARMVRSRPIPGRSNGAMQRLSLLSLVPNWGVFLGSDLPDGTLPLDPKLPISSAIVPSARLLLKASRLHSEKGAAMDHGDILHFLL